MKTLFISILAAFAFTAHADMRCISLELFRGATNETMVSVDSMVKAEQRTKVNVTEAAKVLLNAEFLYDGIFAVIHSEEPIPAADLLPLFKAMSEHGIGIQYVQIGHCPTGLDVWNQPRKKPSPSDSHH